MAGEFHAGGVHCEQCHGLGSNHQITESADDIHIDNTSADGKLFNEDGSLANVDGLGVSLDYVCYQCHKDENQEGGSKSEKSMSDLAEKAATFHVI